MVSPSELRFSNSRARLRRAYVHLEAFEAEWRSFFEKESTRTKIRKDKNPGWHIVSAEPTPECLQRINANNLSLILGEIAYQLRAALDGLMWDAITYKQGFEPPADANRIEFPILNGKIRDFKGCAFHKFPFPGGLAKWLENIQPDTADPPIDHPDSGLQNTLEDIHNLARFDRHRRLRVVGMMDTHAEIEIETTPPGGGVIAYDWLDWAFFGGKYDFLRLKVRLPGDLIPHDIRLKTKMTIEVAAEDVPMYLGNAAGVQINRFIQAVDRVICRFDEEFTWHGFIFPLRNTMQLDEAERKPTNPISPAKDAQGDFAQFTDFMRRLVSVPHSEIKAQLEAEKIEKRSFKTSASRAFGAPPEKP